MTERALLSLRPTRLGSLGSYLVWVILWVLAALAYLNVGGLFPDYVVPVVGARIQTVVALLVGFLGLVVVLRAELARLGTRYVVMETRIIRREGIVRRRTEQMPFSKVERLELIQGLVQRIFKIGDILVDTGDDSMTLASLRNVELVHDELSRQVTGRAQ